MYFLKILLCVHHKYRPEHVPSLSWHGAQIWGICGIPAIKITALSGAYLLHFVCEETLVKHLVGHKDTFCLCCLHVHGCRKSEYPIGSSCLMMPLQRAA